MTKETAPKWLPLVQALAEGKQLQREHSKLGSGRWIDVNGLLTDSDLVDECPERYRVKPEPRRWWANIYRISRRPSGWEGALYPTLEEAKQSISAPDAEQIEVVEVLK